MGNHATLADAQRAAMRLPQPARREIMGRFMGAAALFLSPMISPALEVPTFSLKGAPGLGGAFEEKPLTTQLGVIGRGKDKTRSGILNACAKKGRKSLETAFAELLEAVKATPGATIIKAEAEERYIYAEFREGNAVDDVEWLLSTDSPIVGYRSSPRAGNDDKRQRGRIRDIRKSLAPQGWKSVGRMPE